MNNNLYNKMIIKLANPIPTSIFFMKLLIRPVKIFNITKPGPTIHEQQRATHRKRAFTKTRYPNTSPAPPQRTEEKFIANYHHRVAINSTHEIEYPRGGENENGR